jgi:hypothetical protein
MQCQQSLITTVRQQDDPENNRTHRRLEYLKAGYLFCSCCVKLCGWERVNRRIFLQFTENL